MGWRKEIEVEREERKSTRGRDETLITFQINLKRKSTLNGWLQFFNDLEQKWRSVV